VARKLTAFLAYGQPHSIEHQLAGDGTAHPLATGRLAAGADPRDRQPRQPGLRQLRAVRLGRDQLHVFRAGRRTFSDPAFPLDEAQDEDDARLGRLFATGIRDLDQVNTILASGHYDVDTWDPDDLGDDTHDGDEPPN
jgi:hypothetical protein